MKIRNARRYALEIAATGQVVGPGDVAEVDDPLGAALCEQAVNWTVAPDPPAVKKAAPTKADEAEGVSEKLDDSPDA